MEKSQRNELIIKMVKEGKTNSQIIEELNVLGEDITDRTIRRIISDNGIEREDYLGYGAKSNSNKAELDRANIVNAVIETANIRKLSEGKHYFYNHKTNELLYTGTLEEFLDNFDYMEKKFKSYYVVKLEEACGNPCIISKHGIRIESNFSQQFSDSKSEIEMLRSEVSDMRKQINELRNIIRQYVKGDI